jgi:hypothetical protein
MLEKWTNASDSISSEPRAPLPSSSLHQTHTPSAIGISARYSATSFNGESVLDASWSIRFHHCPRQKKGSPLTDRIRRAPLRSRAADWNLALIWVVVIIGLLTAIGSVGFILDESLISYSTCSVRNEGCSGGDAGWYSSMGLTLFGGFATVITCGAIGIRRHTRRSGVLYPVAGLSGLLLLTAVGYALLKALTGT